MRGPFRYTVVNVPSAILSLMMCCLYLLDLNISKLRGLISNGTTLTRSELLQVVFGERQPLKNLLLLDNAVDDGFERLVVRLFNRSSTREGHL